MSAESEARPDHPMASLIRCDGALVMWHESEDMSQAYLLCFGRKRYFHLQDRGNGQ